MGVYSCTQISVGVVVLTCYKLLIHNDLFVKSRIKLAYRMNKAPVVVHIVSIEYLDMK